MNNYPIDPPIELRTKPAQVLRTTDQARKFVAQKIGKDRLWRDLERKFDRISDEWTAIDAIVALELLAVEHDLLIEDVPVAVHERVSLPARRVVRSAMRFTKRPRPGAVVSFPLMEDGLAAAIG